MFAAVSEAASKVAGAASDTVSGTISFSEHEAMKHIRALTGLGSDRSAAIEYVVKEFQNIKETAPEDVDVDVDLKNVVLKVSPKNAADAVENAVLVSANYDTSFDQEEDSDTSSVAVMLELARGVSQSSDGFKNSVIFLFNTGEEEGLNGAHSFVTQNPWNETVRIAIDLAGMGIGGKPAVSQGSITETGRGLKDPVIVLFGKEGLGGALNQQPLKQVVLPAQAMNVNGKPVSIQDLFSEGVKNSATDFQVYKEVGGLSGLDFEYGQGGTTVFHTKNDKSELLKAGSVQHLGENMLPFLLQVASSDELPE